MWAVLAVYESHWACPALGVCAFLVYTAQAPAFSSLALQGNCPKQALGFMHFPGLRCSDPGSRVLQKSTDSVGPTFCALPSSKLLRQPCAWQMHCPRWAVHLNHLPSPGHLVSWVHPSTISGVLCVSSGELISGCDPPGRFQLSRIPGKLG